MCNNNNVYIFYCTNMYHLLQLRGQSILDFADIRRTIEVCFRHGIKKMFKKAIATFYGNALI